MKFAMCIWLPSSLHACSKMYHKKGIKAYAAPLVLYAIGVALVMGGRDLGTAMILVFIGGVAFLIVGFPGKWMGVGVLGAVVMVGALAVSSPNRLRRILATYGDCSAADAQSVCYQSIHAKYAIASGGFLGLGIGNSREKWNYLPAAHNDFIFAIIGEETGFVGCAIVLLFFAILAWCMIVIALQVTDRYVAMVLMCVAIWIVGQAMVNIGVVVGVFPVLGVPMPFVSAGGSSMIMCLTAAGLVVGTYALSTADKTVASERVSRLGNHESRHTTYRSCWRRYRRTCQSAARGRRGDSRHRTHGTGHRHRHCGGFGEGFGAGGRLRARHHRKSAVPTSP